MGTFHEDIPEHMLDWVRKQTIFWIATAPISPDKHVSVSGKGTRQTYIKIERKRLEYEDLSGSGVDTIAHIKENGRVTILFLAFEGPPRLLRIYGKATHWEYGTPEYHNFFPPEKRATGSRALIMVDIEKVCTSCGFGVPLFEHLGERPTLMNWSSALEKPEAMPGSTLHDYWFRKSVTSSNGLPGLEPALKTVGKPFQNNWVRPKTVRKNGVNAKKEPPAAAAEKPKATLAAQQVMVLKDPSTWLDDRLVIGLFVGMFVSAMMNYAGITLL